MYMLLEMDVVFGTGTKLPRLSYRAIQGWWWFLGDGYVGCGIKKKIRSKSQE